MLHSSRTGLVLVLALHVSTVLVKSAAIFEERPYHDEPYYPPDLDGAPASLTDLKWNKTLLTYRIINNPTGVPVSAVRTTIRRAFDSWSRVTKLDFLESPYSANVDIQLAFVGMNHQRRGQPCRFSQEITLAHAFFPEAGDVHFNTKYFFNGDSSMEQFLNTAVHEIGHSLGLLHSSSRDSIMYGAQLQQLYSEPQPEDVQAIQEIYGVRTAASPPVTTRPTSETRPRTTTDLCSLPSYDTIVIDHRGHICVLAGRFYYNLNETNPPPRKISAKWPGLPVKVDAAVTHLDKKTYFFKGDIFWKYDKRQLVEDYPKPIAAKFPGVPAGMDAILLSNTGGFTAFKGDRYWVYDTRKPQPVSRDFPKSIEDFRGIPRRVDAALVVDEVRRFIFSGLRYYEIDGSNRVIGGEGDVRRDWFNC